MLDLLHKLKSIEIKEEIITIMFMQQATRQTSKEHMKTNQSQMEVVVASLGEVEWHYHIPHREIRAMSIQRRL